MSMIAINPPGYFGRAVDAARRLMPFRCPASEAPAAPQPFGADDWAIEPGAASGDFVVTVLRIPDLGDASHWGDGLGALVRIEWRASSGAAAEVDLTGPGSTVIHLAASADVSLRAVATSGTPDWSAPKAATVEAPAELWPTTGLWPADEDDIWPGGGA